jgi:hypothetical protein
MGFRLFLTLNLWLFLASCAAGPCKPDSVEKTESSLSPSPLPSPLSLFSSSSPTVSPASSLGDNGNRDDGRGSASLEESQKKEPSSLEQQAVPSFDRVFVYQFDGTVQCDSEKKPIPMKEVEGKLLSAEIKVFQRSHQKSGFFMIQVCGAPQGQIYRFQIDQKDLEKALSLGFKQWVNP